MQIYNELDKTIYSKNFFHIKENSNLILIEKFNNKIDSNSNIINYFELEENSNLLHLVIQNNTIDSKLQFTTHTNCNNNSKFNQLIFNCSDTSGRNHHYAFLNGSLSEVNLKGLFFAKNNQIIDNKTEINHLNQGCTSNQTYRGILTDFAIPLLN